MCDPVLQHTAQVYKLQSRVHSIYLSKSRRPDTPCIKLHCTSTERPLQLLITSVTKILFDRLYYKTKFHVSRTSRYLVIHYGHRKDSTTRTTRQVRIYSNPIIILSKYPACSGKYSKSSLLVTQTKSLPFLISYLLAATT